MTPRSDSDNPRFPADAYRQGLRLYRQGSYGQAAEALSKVPWTGDPAGAVAKYYHGMSYRALGASALREGKLDEAERHLAAAARSLGKEGDLPSTLACLYAGAGRAEDCARQTEKALAARGDDVRAWIRHAQAQWRSARGEDAQATLRQALRRLGDQAELHNQMGLFLAGRGHWAQARDAFAQAIQADCSNADAYRYHALAAAALNDTPTALRSLQRAYELQPNDLVLAHQLALTAKAASEQGHPVVIRLPEPSTEMPTSQMGQLARYVTTEGDFVDAFLALPASAIDGELFAVLDAALQTALAEHGDYADLHLRASQVLARLDRLEEAMHHARAAVAINGRYVRALLHLAGLCAQTGQADQAVEHLEQAIAGGADWVDVHCRAGELLASLGRGTEARAHLERALELQPGCDQATRAMSALAA